MIEDFSSSVFIAGYLLLFFIVAWLALRRMVDILVARAKKRRRMAEPETHGDDGGRPYDTPAPEDGSGLLAGKGKDKPWSVG